MNTFEVHNPVLKAARLEIAPHIPELAPQLADDPEAIRAALCQKIGELGVNPLEVPENNLNKTERHTMVSFLAAEQKAVIIRGTGPTARYNNVGNIIGRSGSAYSKTNSLLAYGMNIVRERYTEGSDTSRTWWSYADERYQALSFQLTPRREVTDEGRTLEQALTSENLADTIAMRYTHFINRQDGELSPHERIRAAHDLAYLVITQAGAHIKDFQDRPGIDNLATKIVFDQNRQKYTIKRHPDDNWNSMRSRNATERSTVTANTETNSRTATMQCPYHTSPGQTKGDTLESFVHATIDLAARHGEFGQVTGWRGKLQKVTTKLGYLPGLLTLPAAGETSSLAPTARSIAREHARTAGRTDLVAWIDTNTPPNNWTPSHLGFVRDTLTHVLHMSDPKTAVDAKRIFKRDRDKRSEHLAADIRLLSTGKTEPGEPVKVITSPEYPNYRSEIWLHHTTAGAVIKEVRDNYAHTITVLSINAPEAQQPAHRTNPQQSNSPQAA